MNHRYQNLLLFVFMFVINRFFVFNNYFKIYVNSIIIIVLNFHKLSSKNCMSVILHILKEDLYALLLIEWYQKFYNTLPKND